MNLFPEPNLAQLIPSFWFLDGFCARGHPEPFLINNSSTDFHPYILSRTRHKKWNNFSQFDFSHVPFWYSYNPLFSTYQFVII